MPAPRRAEEQVRSLQETSARIATLRDNVEKVMGLSVTLVTSAQDDTEGRMLLMALGVPLRS